MKLLPIILTSLAPCLTIAPIATNLITNSQEHNWVPDDALLHIDLSTSLSFSDHNKIGVSETTKNWFDEFTSFIVNEYLNKVDLIFSINITKSQLHNLVDDSKTYLLSELDYTLAQNWNIKTDYHGRGHKNHTLDDPEGGDGIGIPGNIGWDPESAPPNPNGCTLQNLKDIKSAK